LVTSPDGFTVPFLHAPPITLATRLLVRSTVLMLTTALAAADARASDDAITLARAGTAAIESRRFGDALEAFTKAAGMRPGDATLCFGAGVAAFMLGRDDVAQARFECALERNPGLVPAAMWLGDLHYRAGRLAEAIATHEAALRRSPDVWELRRQLDSWRKEKDLQSRFLEARSEHFVALFETASDEPLVREIVTRLEAAYRRIGNTLGVYPARPITVLLYTRAQFNDITSLAGWSVAAYDGRIRLPLSGATAQPDELDRVLSHELVHAVVAGVGGRAVPGWMNEGLATVLEPGGLEPAAATVTRAEAGSSQTTLPGNFGGLSARNAEIAYTSAARAVRRLIEQRGVATVVALLEDLGRGTPFDYAFEQRVAMRYEDFAALVMRQ
jgi:tetratricopeptide (TPR) repeat protein